ncbi:MAG: M48 family metallopeptidase [Verrucomicrobia bacterium]|nr:M48 family metallopeptidase [Verrucomicrobiota bacterium]
MIAFVLVSALVLYRLLDTTARVLNIRSLQTEVPAEFQSWYDPGRYRKSQAYTHANTVLNLVSSWAGLTVLLLFWFFGGFERLDAAVRSLHLGPVATGLCYFGLLAAAQEIFGLPFAIYHTFILEQRFGFNRTSVATFVQDKLKELLLSVIVFGLLAWAILSVFERFGPGAWIYAWLVTALSSLALMYFAPKLVLPLFFKMKPIAAGELRDSLTDLCRRQRFPVRDLYVIDGSRRSAKANAFFTGFGSNKRIALFDTLIANHTIPELSAVLAHEIGHAKRGHVWKHLVAAQISLFCFFWFASWFLTQPALFAAFGVSRPSYYVGLVLFTIFLQPLSILLGIASCYFSRRHEFEADRFAAQAIGDAEPLVSALKKLSKDNLANLTPHPLLVGLEFSHPPVLARIAALRAQSPTHHGDAPSENPAQGATARTIQPARCPSR